MVTQREDFFPHCGAALARAVPPQYGQHLQNNREKSDSCGRRIRFYSAVELAVTLSTVHIIHLQFRSENSSSAVFRFGTWSAYIAGVDMSVSNGNDVEDQLH